jgi:hypothetical protein
VNYFILPGRSLFTIKSIHAIERTFKNINDSVVLSSI